MYMHEWLEEDGIVTSAEEIQSFVGTPHEAVVKKTISRIDAHVIRYLSMSPLFFLSTCGADGRCDVSPRGDVPGFVKAIDEKRLIYPERPGNRRVDSLLNIIERPQVGMLFLIPGQGEVVRINGKASIFKSGELIRRFDWKGKTTGLAVVVEVEECFIHCPRAFQQAGIWKTETWPEEQELPSIADMFKAHLKISGYEGG
ncbi:pyridoxamine 5'-phosphate oxidase family protein [Paenibacillus sp. TRM 82003]|nr:pyridoxamine 5'-phosphate oxidase family protein [Paenibacillus sp. TRM 82003]